MKQSLKKIMLKVIQFLYRNAAQSSDLGFDLGDIHDPLFGYMSGTPVDRYLLNGAFKSIADTKSMNVALKSGVEVGDIGYLNLYFKDINKVKLQFVEDERIHFSNGVEIAGDLTVHGCEVSNRFDIAIATQVLSFVKNDLQAIKNFKQMMKLGALLIGSEPLVAPLSIYDDSRWGENRRYSPKSLRALLEQEFEIIEFKVLGNAVSSAALVLGIPVESLNKELLEKNRQSHGSCMFYIAKKVTLTE